MNSAVAALIGLVLAIVLIIKKLQPVYSLMIGALAGGLLAGWGLDKNEIFTPMTVTLASEGQTMTVETTIQPKTLDILDYDGNGTNMPEYDAETGTYTCSYLWLTASISESSFKDGKYTVVLTAEKNTTGIARTLYVGGMDKNYSDSMEVRQE